MASSNSNLSFFPNIPLIFLFSTLAAIPLAYGHHGPEKYAHLHFYWHEYNSGGNATAIVVASLNRSSSSFGNIAVMDDALREGADASSKLIGRAQGLNPQASLEELAFLTAANLEFTEGEYNGSTLAVFGRSVFSSSTREWSVVGGTGQLRLARGYALGNVRNNSNGFLLMEFDVYVTHYSSLAT